MRGKRFTEEQIIAVLKEADAGAKTADLCRRYGVSEQTFYRWKARPAQRTEAKEKDGRCLSPATRVSLGAPESP